jgi:hypothetical protein
VTLQSVLGCKVCSALEKQSVPRSKAFFDAKCASAFLIYILCLCLFVKLDVIVSKLSKFDLHLCFEKFV